MTAERPVRPTRRRQALAAGATILVVLVGASIMGGFVVSESRQSGWSTSGIVDAPVDRVWQALLDESEWLSDEDRRAFARHDGSEPFVVQPPGAKKARTEVDGPGRSISTQGEWWYRGTLLVEPHGSASLVTYRVENVAPGAGWWIARFVQGPSHAREVEEHLRGYLDDIRSHLGISVRPKAETHARRIEERGA